jgi:MEMO1 family protein
MTDLRPSPLAGQWYPADKAALTQSVEAYLDAAKVEAPAGEIVGLIVPHAGHRYSGPVAAHAFRLVRGLSVETVAILCPSHFHADGPLLTSEHAAYATPLGAVEVDREAVRRLRTELVHMKDEDKGTKDEGRRTKDEEEQMLVEIRNDREHAIEIELPFLQRTLTGNFKLIPLMLRDQSERVTHALALALTKILSGQRTLIVASSDLSHFFPQAIAQQLDMEILQHINSCDPSGLLAAEAQAEAKGYGLACGYGAIAATLWATRDLGATQAKVLHHATSGDVTGDYSQVVGYGAGVMWKSDT